MEVRLQLGVVSVELIGAQEPLAVSIFKFIDSSLNCNFCHAKIVLIFNSWAAYFIFDIRISEGRRHVVSARFQCCYAPIQQAK